MKGKIFLFLFALPFFGIGVFMGYSAGHDVSDWWRMQSWTPTPATLTNAGYSSHSDDDSTTYEAYATYRYAVDGVSYTGTRVGIADGADSIGDYQIDTGNRLSRAWQAGDTVTVFVNPDNPNEAIIDRGLRWGLVGFKSIFLFAFGGVGLGLMIFAVRSKKPADADDPAFRDTPWLANDDWQTATIRSSSKASMYVMWGFAGVWCLISAPLPFVVYGEVVDKENYAALFGLLFPLIGIGLVSWAIRQTREWTRFGPTPVTLDPFPGSIGGHVGGTIDIATPYDAATTFQLTLTAVKSYISGSGKNRSRREKANWQDTVVAHTESSLSGTRVIFRFDVPEGLPESDAVQAKERYHLWRLNLKAEMPGVDLDRDFEIPVYATSEGSLQLPEKVLERARDAQDEGDDRAVRDRLAIGYGATGGKTISYPAGRNLGSGFGGVLIGSIFAAIGWWLMTSEGERLFGAIFGGIGALIAVASLYMVTNSLVVTLDGATIRSVRRVLGIPVRRREVRNDGSLQFTKESRMQSQSGKTHVMHYSLFLHDAAGHSVCVGEGFRGENEADAAIRVIGREFGIRVQGREPPRDDADQFDALAADR